MKQTRSQPAAGHGDGGLGPERLDVTRQHDRQHPLLLALDRRDGPACRTRITLYLRSQRCAVELRVVAVAGVFDQHHVVAQWQHVEEAEAVDLGHGGIHQQRSRQTVAAGETHLLAQKLLIRHRQMRTVDGTPPIDHRPRVDSTAVCELYPPRRDSGDLRGQPSPVAQRLAHDRVEAHRADAVIAAMEPSREVRKADVVVRPRPGHQRTDPRALGRGEVRSMERPRMIATQSCFALQDEQPQLWPHGQQPPGNEAVGKTAADQNQVDVDGPGATR